MIKDYKVFYIILFLISACNVRGQADLCMKVLSENKIGKDFTFDLSSTKDGKNKVEIKYMGVVQTKTNQKYKIVSWSSIWGVNEHTSGVIFVYDMNNLRIGKYVLGSMFELPDRIEKNNMVFNNQHRPNCDTTIITEISFTDGIPQQFFLKCQGQIGDVYSFENIKNH